MRPQRITKRTVKMIEYNNNIHRGKKQEKKEVLKKRIEKQKIIIEQQLQKEVEKDDDYIEVVRDENDKIFKDLYYNNDEIAKKTQQLILQFPAGFLPPIFKALVPLLVEKKVEPLKVKVLYSKLINGDYHTLSSKSDKNIATGVKTLLKLEELKQYDNDDLSNLIINHRTFFYNILKTGLDKKHSISSIKSNMVRLVRLLFIAYGNKKTTPIYAKYAIIMKKLGEKYEEEDDNNELNDNEKGRFLDFRYILDEQKLLEEKFNNIVNKNTKEAYNVNMNLILVSLYSLTPPLRQEVFSLQFKHPGDDDKADYIQFKRDGSILDLNLDKKKHSSIDIPISDHLHNILKTSFELYPRRYLFTDFRNYPKMEKPLRPSTVGDRLRKIFIKFGVNVGPSILRSSYTTYRFNEVKGNLTMSKIKEMATLMRTSPKYILSSYRKILKEDDNGAIPAIPIKIEGGNNVIIKQEPIEDNRPIHQQVVKEDPYVKNNNYLKDKYKNNDAYRNKVLSQQQEYKAKIGNEVIQKRKIISKLRNSPQYRKVIKPETLIKYGINLDDYK